MKVMPTAFYLGQLVDVRGHGRAEVIDVGTDLALGTQFHGRIKGKYPAHAAASPSHAAAACVQQYMVRGGNCHGTGVLSLDTAGPVGSCFHCEQLWVPLLHELAQCGTLRMTPYSGPTQPSCDR